MGPLVATIVRLIVPVFILRWPLAGFIASVVADTIDVVLIAAIRSGMFEDYTSADKLLDTYMLAFAALASLRWQNRIARSAAIALFGYRVAGVIILQLVGTRWVLFVFPNVFDFFFVYHLMTIRWFPVAEVTGYRVLAYVLLILGGMKLFQEFILHVVEFRPLCWVSGSISELTRTGPGSVVVDVWTKAKEDALLLGSRMSTVATNLDALGTRLSEVVVESAPGSVVVNVWMRAKESALFLGGSIWELEREYIAGPVTQAPSISGLTASFDALATRLSNIGVDELPQIDEYQRQCIRFR